MDHFNVTWLCLGRASKGSEQTIGSLCCKFELPVEQPALLCRLFALFALDCLQRMLSFAFFAFFSPLAARSSRSIARLIHSLE